MTTIEKIILALEQQVLLTVQYNVYYGDNEELSYIHRALASICQRINHLTLVVFEGFAVIYESWRLASWTYRGTCLAIDRIWMWLRPTSREASAIPAESSVADELVIYEIYEDGQPVRLKIPAELASAGYTISYEGYENKPDGNSQRVTKIATRIVEEATPWQAREILHTGKELMRYTAALITTVVLGVVFYPPASMHIHRYYLGLFPEYIPGIADQESVEANLDQALFDILPEGKQYEGFKPLWARLVAWHSLSPEEKKDLAQARKLLGEVTGAPPLSRRELQANYSAMLRKCHSDQAARLYPNLSEAQSEALSTQVATIKNAWHVASSEL